MTSSSKTPVGLLIANLGTPDAPDVASVRRYLAQFLSDPRVVDLPRFVWLPALYGVVLNTRPKKSAHAYQTIWNHDIGEGPLKTITRLQAEKLARWAATLNGAAPVVVDYALRYGSPSIPSRIEALMAKGCERIALLPLYPQYAASTNASVADDAFAALKRMRKQPALRIGAPYYDAPAYIEALAASIRRELASLDFEPEILLASFHGLPQLQVDRGDPYRTHCEATQRLLREALGMSEEKLRLSFQSRFGRAKWIGPYTSDVVTELAQAGVKRLAVVAPGFSADCLETIEELGVEIRDLFLKKGGEKFARLPCLNDSAEGMAVIETLARREIAGWV
ncbi:ferrochelatase [Methylocystis parvus]|uniref:Ferrochelatase n=1 Tax=Methylocystis parvus TaxID=134 RepID=A0A6B8MAF9_9HYPH|nr:ferrochelatase [Methylocystis parvus]QGM97640.1 ferrochelatase [Methylocystis parvus]WBJ98426.1 ferrochelatase [Methylocystis parvus OBBP]